MPDRALPTSWKTALQTLVTLALFANGASGQNAAARPDRGTMPNGSYAVSDFENVSLQNGNVSLEFPLASLPPIAGGKLSWTIKAHYNSKLWDITRKEYDAPDGQWHPYVVDSPQLSDRGGWRISGQYLIEIRPVSWDFDYMEPLPQTLPYNEEQLLTHNWYKVVLVMPDGSEHELRPVDFAGAADNTGLSFLHGYYNVSPATHGTMRYYSFDGSYLWATVTSDSNWTVYLQDGTKVVQSPDGIQRIQDTNGNKIKIYSDTNGTHYQDEQTGREIRYAYDPAANDGQGAGRVFYNTVGGFEKFIEVKFGHSTVQGKLYHVNDWEAAQINPRTCMRNGILNAQMTVIREIVLPQTEQGQAQRKFVFHYNSDETEVATNTGVRFSCDASLQSYTRTVSKGWGGISWIEMPSGADINYSYSLDSGNPFANLPIANEEIAGETITSKALTHDGVTDTWDYEIESSSGVSKVSAPDGSEVWDHKFTHSPYYGYGIGQAGLSYRIVNPFSKIERHWIGLQFDGANMFSPGGPVSFNPVVDVEYTTLTDANGNGLKMSAKAFQYDFNGNVIHTTEYDWFDPSLVTRDNFGVPTGVPPNATVLRVTNNSYYNQAAGSASGNVYAKRSLSTANPLILNALKQTTLGPAIAQFSYDGQAYGTPPTVGNLTTKKVWDDLDNKWITTSSVYGAYGNLATSIDARVKSTQFYYDDATHALPNRVVVDPENGTGQQTSTTAFDYHTGLITHQTDPNNATTEINYTNHLLGSVDPFGRQGIAIGPLVNGQRAKVFTFYEDAARRVRAESDLFAEGDRLLKSQTSSDQLGRTILVEQSENGSSYSIAASTVYQQSGRITLVSNPKRSGAATTDGWTRSTKDVAGRTVEVATFGGAAQPSFTGTGSPGFTGSVTTAYDGNFTTVTDQDGKVRRSMVDALGRLIRIDEPDSNNPLSNNLGPTNAPVQPTSYAYDVFGNLVTVVQGLQTRTFTYDSLSRLRSSLNPESGTINYLYDDNGNLTRKTDARGIYIDYVYDSLNRNTQVNHSDTSINPDVTRVYDGATNGKGRLWETYAGGSFAVGANVEHTKIQSYSVMGQPLVQVQDFKTNGVWWPSYQIQRSYSLSGSVTAQTYPSGRTVAYAYDSAGRLNNFNGNLGDGVTRTYSAGIQYSSIGGITKEQFGTDTPVYNKAIYNSRGQLSEIRVGTYSTDETWWNRGAIINHYSSACAGACNGAGNNGNLKNQAVFVPANDQISSYTTWSQSYDYDNLNRLQRVHEYTGNTQLDWQQEYLYDRYGNRSISQSGTSQGKGINATQAAVTQNTTSNRIYAPGETDQNHSLINYDPAGNQIKDYYSSAGVNYDRTYDAENRMTSSIAAYSSPASTKTSAYSYNGEGQRVRRNIDGLETWQIFGFEGELLAEYAANAAPSSPQKEYGYRNGQLLITAEAGGSGSGEPQNASWTNTAGVTVSGNTLSKTASYGWGNAGAVSTQGIASGNGYVEFTAAQLFVERICGLSVGDSNQSHEDIDFGILLSDGGYIYAWESGVMKVNAGAYATTDVMRVAVESGQVNYYKNGVVFYTSTTPPAYPLIVDAAIRNTGASISNVMISGVSALNVARASNGASASASSTSGSQSPGKAIDGDRKGLGYNWWTDDTSYGYPDWMQVDFSGAKTISEIDVIGLQEDWPNAVEPTAEMTSHYALTDFEVQYWNGSGWVTVPGGSVTGNNKVWKKFTFSPLTTSKIRVNITNVAGDNHSQVVELEAWTASSGGSGSASGNVNWLVADHLGTPRMVIDKTGALANVKRHDYLPFGEELFANQGSRGIALGYGAPDNVRHKFTSKERDSENGLDFFGARYLGITHGRFISVDPALASASVTTPQSWNRYTYAFNNPLAYVDPTGAFVWSAAMGGNQSDAELKRSAGNDATRRRQMEGIIQRRNAFRDGLRRAAEAGRHSDQPQTVARAVGAYENEGEANGVTVTFGQTSTGAPAESGAGPTGGLSFADDGTATAQVLVTVSDTANMDSIAEYVAHEGSHTADRQAFASYLTGQIRASGGLEKFMDSGGQSRVFASPHNRTVLTTELRAYIVSGLVSQGRDAMGRNVPNSNYGGHEVWNRSWRAADREGLRAVGAFEHVTTSPSYANRLTERQFQP